MWVVRFSDKQLEVVRAVLRSEEHRGPALEGALEALDLARWDELPEAELPWPEVSSSAKRQGISEAGGTAPPQRGRKPRGRVSPETSPPPTTSRRPRRFAAASAPARATAA